MRESDPSSIHREESLPLDRRYRRSSGHPLLAVIFITLGVLFLLNNFGVLEWSMWGIIWRFWPVILILLGLDLVFGRSRLGAFLVFFFGLMVVGLLIGGVLSGRLSGGAGPFGSTDLSGKVATWSVPAADYPTVQTRVVRVQSGAERLNIDDASQAEVLRGSTRYFGTDNKPRLSVSESDHQLLLDLVTKEQGVFGWGWGGRPETQLTLGQPQLVTDLEVNGGAGETDIRLHTVKMKTLTLHLGAGSMNIDLGTPSVPSGQSNIEVGTGSAEVRLPREVGLQVQYEVGLGSLEVQNSSFHGKGEYSSPGYAIAPLKMRLKVKVGVGSVTIEQ